MQKCAILTNTCIAGQSRYTSCKVQLVHGGLI